MRGELDEVRRGGGERGGVKERMSGGGEEGRRG